MTLFEALPKSDNQIVIPIGGVSTQGEACPGIVDPNWLSQAFAKFINLNVPLSEADYQALLDASSENWKLNWQEFRKQGII